MHGNVEEWCADWHALYQYGQHKDPCGPPSGQTRVLRGGSCRTPWTSCRSAQRNNNVPHYSWYDVGFRVVLDPK
jgi:formylglycine-generating enzyme required for sulfatase activity